MATTLSMAGTTPADEETASRIQSLGRCQLLAKLGQGGMGTIHLGIASGLGEFRKLLVIKELRRDLASNDKFVEMFMAEAKLAARLNHPNVVQTLEAGLEGDRYFLSMEFLDGQPFSELLKRAELTPRIALAIRLQVLCDALAGLHYAHTLCDYDGSHLQIVHRDISPQNVFVTYDGQVKVLDFGIAKAANLKDSTHPGVFKGKFAYAAPEQVQGLAVDGRIDVFAVGVMLWEAVAMRRFAPGTPTHESVDARLAGAEPRLAQAMPSVDPLLAEICDKAIHIDPAERYASAAEFRVALAQYLQSTGAVVDSAAIGFAIRAKFVSERASMHRLIDAHVNVHVTETPSHSSIRNVQASPKRSSAHDDATTVGDLSRLARATRPDNPVARPALEGISAAPRKRGGLWTVAATSIVIAAAICYAIASSAGNPIATPQPSAIKPFAAHAPSTANVQTPAARTAKAQPAAPTSPDVVPPTAAPVTHATSTTATSTTTNTTTSALTATAHQLDAHVSRARPGASLEKSHHLERAMARPGSRERARKPDNGAAGAAAATTSPDSSADDATPAAHKEALRPLDLEDPFR